MTGGAVVLGFGLVLMLVGTALASSGVRRAAEMVPGAGGVAVLAASAEERQADKRSFQSERAAIRREQDAQERHTAAQYRRQPRARANLERDTEREAEPVPF